MIKKLTEWLVAVHVFESHDESKILADIRRGGFETPLYKKTHKGLDTDR